MAKTFKYFISAIFLLFLTALLEPLLISLLKSWGWYDSPAAAVGPVMNWISRIIGADTFPWVAGIVIGITIGVWVDSFLRRVDKRRPTKEKKLKSWGRRADTVSDNIRKLISNPFLYGDERPKIWAQTVAVISEAESLGFCIPASISWNNDDGIEAATAYLKTLSQLTLNDQYELALSMSKTFDEEWNKRID